MKLGLILGAVSLFAASLFGAEDCAKFVDVKIGTAGTGHTYPGVVAPFGMVQPSPETGYSTWRYCSGYHNDDKRILSFGQTHLSGTGCPDSGDVPLRAPELRRHFPDRQRRPVDEVHRKEGEFKLSGVAHFFIDKN